RRSSRESGCLSMQHELSSRAERGISAPVREIPRLRLGMTRTFLQHLWNGPSDLPRALKLEWRFVAVRWLGIAFVIPAVLLVNLGSERLLAAYAVIAIAAIYNFTV